jgi:hypothetical protein
MSSPFQSPALSQPHSSSSSSNSFEANKTCKTVDTSSSTNAAAIASSIIAAAAAASAAQNNQSANSSLSNTSMSNNAGNGGGGGGPIKNSIKLCRRRKARTVFSDQQLSGLEKRFETQKYLSTPERVELANSLGLSETQVFYFFQNFKVSIGRT